MKTIHLFIFLGLIFHYSNAAAQNGYTDYENQLKQIYIDNFMTNSGDWSTALGTATTYEYAGSGAIELKHGSPGYGIITLAKNLSISDNYQIEARILPSPEGGLNGIIFGRSSENYFRFGISRNQEYIIVRDKNNKYASTVQEWTKEDNIKGTGYNLLTIRKYDNHFYFFINRELVFHTSENLEHKKGIGLVVSADNASMFVDHLKVFNYKNQNDRPIITNQGSYNKVKSSEKKLVYIDEFNSNSGDWSTELGTKTNFSVYSGYGLLEHGNEHYGIITLEKRLSLGDNYEVEATINANKGGLNGLIFGRKGDDFFRFGINSDPTFLIVRDKDRSYASTVEGWTSYKGFRKNDYNKLTVRKYKGTFYFYVNKVLVFETKENLELGKNFGLVVSDDNAHIKIDSFKIYNIGKKRNTGSTE